MAKQFLVNTADALDPRQAMPDRTDWQNQLNGFKRDGVVTGGAIVEDPVTPDMTIDVSACLYQIAGQLYNYAGAVNIPIASNASGLLRVDTVTLDTAGALTVNTGTPAASVPAQPDIAADTIQIGMILVPDGVTAITNDHIQDKRINVTASGVGYMIAASDANDYEKLIANEVLDGTDDHIQIQAAADKYSKLFFSTGIFAMGETVALNTLQHIEGSGWATIFQAQSITVGIGGDIAVFTSKGNSASMIKLSHFAMDGNYSAGGANCHGIHLRNTAVDNPPPSPGSNTWHYLEDLFLEGFRVSTNTVRKGIWFESANATIRANTLNGIYGVDFGHSAIHLDGSSDNHLIHCHMGASNQYGLLVEAANNTITSCKFYFTASDAFRNSGSRNNYTNIQAQDMNGDGFHDIGDRTTITGAHIGSELAGRTCVTGLHAGGSHLEATGILWRVGSGTMDRAIRLPAGPTDRTISGRFSNVIADFAVMDIDPAGLDPSDVLNIKRTGSPNFTSGDSGLVRTETATFTLGPEHRIVDVDSSGAPVTVNLPNGATVEGFGWLVRRRGGNAVTLDPAGAETIDGSATLVLDSDKAAVGFVSIGTTDYQVIDTVGTIT